MLAQKKILIMRHGEAFSGDENPKRPLNEIGILHVKKMAAWAHHMHIPIKTILHSDVLRAKETAEIMAEKYGISTAAHPALHPEALIVQLAEIIGDLESHTLLVGHLPNIDRLSNLLITYDEACPTISFLPAGIACFSLGENACLIDWAIYPRLVNEKAILF